MSHTSALPRHLRLLRETLGLTQCELAAAAGTTQATISRLETGDQQPSMRLLRRLAATLGVEPGVLLMP